MPSKSKSTAELSNFDKDVADIAAELAELLIKKHYDYGPTNISEAPGGAINGLMVRMHDKMARMKNLIYNARTPNYESLEDTLMDMANYSIIALMNLRGKWPNK
jgi:hypothetical protein